MKTYETPEYAIESAYNNGYKKGYEDGKRDAYTEELASIVQQADKVEARNKELEKECAWLKSCLNCKIRKECPRHCGKVVHDCDHWDYGDSAVDAVEVVHGRWLYEAHKESSNYRWNVTAECSECCDEKKEIWAGFFPNVPDWLARDVAMQSAKSVKLSNYCPNCGADMRGEEDG